MAQSDLATGWMIGVRFPEGAMIGIFLFATASKPPLGPTQPLIQSVPETLIPGVKRLRREVEHLPPSSAEVKNAWTYTSTPSIRLHGVVLN
jgi:hypothetical protein